MKGLKLAWYGDDFTGATDTLATAAQAGLRSLLFLRLPTQKQLAQCEPLDCLGLAGAARSMTPEQMRVELLPVGRLFAELHVPVVHYKICSTFDSSLRAGNVGVALKTLQAFVENPFVPIVGGQPSLGRFCVFGNLFARAGSGGPMYRLDRHPTMRKHPVTPMHEADLRLHLAQQGLAPVACVDYPSYDESPTALDARLNALLTDAPDAVLLDVARPANLPVIGRLIWQHAQQQRLLAVGPSSVVQALAAYWQTEADLDPTVTTPRSPSANLASVSPAQGPVLVLAGSLSPLTAQQVQCATSYTRVALNPQRLADAITASVVSDSGHASYTYPQQMAAHVAGLLREGQSVLVFTSNPTQPTTTASDSSSNTDTDASALAIACGQWLALVLQATPVQRLGIAGGDTSSHAVQALNAWGLSYLQSLSPGVALCRLHSDEPHLDGMEISLKGGQMGTLQVFEELLHGT